jgi:hypothetical protein
LTPAHQRALDDISEPDLAYPAMFNRHASPVLAQAGATVNGVRSVAAPEVPTSDRDIY